MIKRLWYINAGIALIALLILISGLSALQSHDPNKEALGKILDIAGQKGKTDGNASRRVGDSVFVATIKDYSDRWAVPMGTVKVTIIPDEAAKLGAKWRLTGGKWHESGREIPRVLTGKKGIEFSEVPGWITPARQTITIKRKETITVKGEYVKRTYGSVVVDIEPNEVLTCKPKWKIGKSGWQASGQRLARVPTGTQKIVFKSLVDWDLPQSIAVKVTKDTLSRVKAVYNRKKYGSLKVIIEPNEVLANNPQWRLGNGLWQKSGAKVDKIAIGKSKISFKTVPGWVLPDEMTVEISLNKLSEIKALYKKIPIGKVQVNINPTEAVKAGAMWKLNGKWYKPGQVVSDIKAGSVQIEAKKINNWLTPKSQKITVKENQLIIVEMVYSTPVPPAPNFTLTGTLCFGNDNGIIWVIVPGQVREKVYFAGEMIGKYRLERVQDGAAVFVCRGHEFVVKLLERSKKNILPALSPKNVQKRILPKPPSKRREPSRGIPSPRRMPPRGIPPR